jgi:ligand-binding sensor domain-containing protein/two-component sensor histidine kinase
MAQRLPGMKVYGQFDGYPADIGYLINQDEKGNIWLGSDKGAIRFDGARFRVFDERDGLRDKEILLAIPCDSGSVIFLPVLNNISRFRKDQADTTIDFSLIGNKHLNNGFYDSFSRNLWIADQENEGFIYRLDGSTLQKVPVNIDVPFQVETIIDNRLYVDYLLEDSHDRSIGIYDLQTKECTALQWKRPLGNGKYAFSQDGKYLAIFSKEKSLLEIYRLLERGKLAYLCGLPLNRELGEIYFDSNHRLWVHFADKGMQYWGRVDQLEETTKAWTFLEDVAVNGVFIDRDDNLWITTRHEGLLFISSRHWENTRRLNELGLLSFRPSAIHKDAAGRLFVGHLFKPQLVIIEHGRTRFIQLDETGAVGVQRIVPLRGRVGVINGGILHLFDEKLNPTTLRIAGAMKDVVSYGERGILLASHKDILHYPCVEKDCEPRSIFAGRVSALEVLADSSIFIGTPNGLYEKQSLDSPAVLVKDSALSKAHISDIVSWKENVFIGTAQQGLYVYNFSTGHFRQLTIKGMEANYIRRIHAENDSTYCLATDQGAFEFTFDEHFNASVSRAFTFFDGLPAANVSDILINDSLVYVTTSEGLGVIRRKREKMLSQKMPVWVMKVSIKDKTIYFPEHLNLSYNENEFSLSLGAPAFDHVGRLNFQYRFATGGAWISSDGAVINFNGLQAGDHKLEFRLRGADAQYQDSLSTLNIHIEPAFWQTWWFRTLFWLAISFLFLLGIYLWVERRKNRRIRKEQQKTKLAELELEAIKAQINPHFIYNCLNSIQYFIYNKKSEEAKEYLQLFASLIRQTMRYSQETFITLEAERDYLSNYLELERMRFKEKLNYSIVFSEQLSMSRMLPSMLLQPYIENAIKHGIAKVEGEGALILSFKRAANEDLLVSIEDNGPGFSESSNNGWGLRLSASRVHAYNQLFNLGVQLKVSDRNVVGEQEKTGCKIELRIPVYENSGL